MDKQWLEEQKIKLEESRELAIKAFKYELGKKVDLDIDVFVKYAQIITNFTNDIKTYERAIVEENAKCE